MPGLVSSLGFLSRKDKYKTEKPYALRYNPVEGIPTENIEKEVVYDVPIEDIRGLEDAPTFDRNGIHVARLNSKMTHEDWSSDEQVKTVFFPEVRELLGRMFESSTVQIFEYRIRKRSKSFPLADGNTLDWAQPVRMAHIDFNLDEITKMVHYHNGPDAPTYLKNRYRCVNLWKPLTGPVEDWPLALCDAQSVVPERDLVVSDVVYEDHAEENYQIHYDPRQRWMYLSDQTVDEVLIFRCADSLEADVGPGVPHCAFPFPSKVLDHIPRESVEIRALILHSE